MMEYVNLERLRLFRDIARERSITKGAALNGISQSAATQHIQELERHFEAPLLDRTTRPWKLTEAGRLYYDFCRDVLRRQEEFEAAMDQVRRQVEGRVRVASIYSVGLSEMTRLEEEFSEKFPGAQISVEYLRPEKVYEAVREDRADLGLVSYPESSKEIQAIPWRQEVMVVAARPDHPLAANTFLRPAELAGQDFVAFDEDLPISRELRRFLREHDVEVRVVMHFDNVLAIREAVALGSGISILPERAILDEIVRGRLVGIPLESPGLRRPLGIIHLRRKKFNRAARALLDLMVKQPAEAPARR